MAKHKQVHASEHTDGTDDIADATASTKGLATATQITKLDGIDAGADVTADNAPQAHTSSHSDGGADEITVENLATAGASGTVVASDGAGGLTMKATQELADPNADRLTMWDDSAGEMAFATVGSGLDLTGTTLTAVPDPYGEMFQNDNTTATTVTTVNIWYEVANFVTGEVAGITFASNALTISAGSAGKYQLSASVAGISESNGKDFEIAISVNDVISVKTKVAREFQADEPGAISLNGILDLADSDVVKLELRNTSDDKDFTVQNANIVLHRIA